MDVLRTVRKRDLEMTLIILQGVVGSTAYGLAREGSDVDRLGVFMAPTEEFLGLSPPIGKAATRVQHEPSDLTLHELGKFCALALQCNPTILELLWLGGDDPSARHWEIINLAGTQLVQLRGDFLSRQRVRDAYLGYAVQQFTRLTNRSRFPDVPVNRIEKHARHLRRLLVQGFELYTSGTMNIRVESPDEYFEFGQRVAQGELDIADELVQAYRFRFDTMSSPLPDQPNTASVEDFLRQTRRELL